MKVTTPSAQVEATGTSRPSASTRHTLVPCTAGAVMTASMAARPSRLDTTRRPSLTVALRASSRRKVPVAVTWPSCRVSVSRVSVSVTVRPAVSVATSVTVCSPSVRTVPASRDRASAPSICAAASTTKLTVWVDSLPARSRAVTDTV